METFQYWIINDDPSFILGDVPYVQNDDIKKVFCPSCDLLIKGHEFFLLQNFCNEKKEIKKKKVKKIISICNLNNNNMLIDVYNVWAFKIYIAV